jgi:hypothetical protein
MKLLLKRGQRDGMLGKVIFTLEMRAEVSDAELGYIQRYKLGKETLYSRDAKPNVDPNTWAGVGKLWLAHALNITVSVNDLVNGKRIECKDILEMLAAEEQIREAASAFAKVLLCAAHFGGEEVIDLAA